MPVAAVVTFPIEGFCNVELNKLGPVHEYDPVSALLALKVNVFPEHTGELLDALGCAGVLNTITLALPGAELQAPTLTTSV